MRETRAFKQQQLLGELTEAIRTQLLALCSIVEQRPDAVVVFTARKAACLADAAERTGLLPPSPWYTSTRILDSDTGYLRGRDVLLVEDIVSSSRTLRKAHRIIATAHPRRVSCFVLTSEPERKDLEKGLGVEILSPFVSSKPEESLIHADGIARSLGKLPRPYNLDWPLYGSRTGVLPNSFVRTCLTGSISIPLVPHSDYNVYPIPSVLDALAEESLAFKRLLSRTQFVKLRVYPVSEPDRGGTSSWVVPVVAIGQFSQAEIADTQALLADAADVDLVTDWTVLEMYRAQQYLLATLVAETTLSRRSDLFCEHERCLKYLFTPAHRKSLLTALDLVIRKCRGSADTWQKWAYDAVPMAEDEAFMASVMAEADSSFVTATLDTELLSRLTETEEYKLRRQIRGASSAKREPLLDKLMAIDPASAAPTFDAAQLGVWLNSVIKDHYGGTFGDVTQRISRYLDDGIDSGAVVPEVENWGGQISRRFRPGEIIEFHREVVALFGLMLILFADAYFKGDQEESATGSGGGDGKERVLSADTIAKLVVGFARFLIRRERIQDRRAIGSGSQDAHLLQLRYAPRGAVVTTPGATFVADVEPVPASLIMLSDAGAIARVGTGGAASTGWAIAKTPNEDPPALWGPDAVTFARIMAVLLEMPGDEASLPGSRLLDTDRLARMTTLTDGTNQVLALGAEIAIALRPLRSGREFTSDEELRTSGMALAINQGLGKATWVIENRTAVVVEAATEEFGKRSSDWKWDWAAVRDAFVGDRGGGDQTGLIRNEIAWLLDGMALLTMMRLALSTRTGSADAIVRDFQANTNMDRLRGVAAISKKRTVAGMEAEELLLSVDPAAAMLHQDLMDYVNESKRVDLASVLIERARAILSICNDVAERAAGGSGTGQRIRSMVLLFGRTKWSAAEWREVGGLAGVTRCFKFDVNQAGTSQSPTLRGIVALKKRFPWTTVNALRTRMLEERDDRLAVVVEIPQSNAPKWQTDGSVILSMGCEDLLSEVARQLETSEGPRVFWPEGAAPPEGALAKSAQAFAVGLIEWLHSDLEALQLQLAVPSSLLEDKDRRNRSKGARIVIQDSNVVVASGTFDVAILVQQLEAVKRELPPDSDDARILGEAIEEVKDEKSNPESTKLRRVAKTVGAHAKSLGFDMLEAYLRHKFGWDSSG